MRGWDQRNGQEGGRGGDRGGVGAHARERVAGEQVAESMICSMTKQERKDPALLVSHISAKSRLNRIAKGSGRSLRQVRLAPKPSTRSPTRPGGPAAPKQAADARAAQRAATGASHAQRPSPHHVPAAAFAVSAQGPSC